MNRPLMFMNNNLIVEQLKDRIWDDYQKIRNCDFQGWYKGLCPIEQAAWDVKFDEINSKKTKNA